MIALFSIALATIELAAPPIEGAPVVITVTADGLPDRGETVRVTHRPGTIHARERAISITDGRGRVEWTPETPGVAEVRAGNEILAVRVGYRSVPATTITTLGLLAAGGVVLTLSGFRRRRKPI